MPKLIDEVVDRKKSGYRVFLTLCECAQRKAKQVNDENWRFLDSLILASREGVDSKDIEVRRGRVCVPLAFQPGFEGPEHAAAVEIGNRDALFMGSRLAIRSEK